MGLEWQRDTPSPPTNNLSCRPACSEARSSARGRGGARAESGRVKGSASATRPPATPRAHSECPLARSAAPALRGRRRC
jgi:hypothetical protein